MSVHPSLADMQCALGRGEELALRWLGWNGERVDYSYARLADAASRAATVLRDAGLVACDVVAVMAGRRPETLIAALGIWKAGGVYCPLYADLGPDPLAARLDLAEARFLVVDAGLYAEVVAPMRPLLPNLLGVLVVASGEAPPPDGCLDFNRLCHAATPLAQAAERPRGSALMLHFTSGTTAPVTGGNALPKAVLHGPDVLEAIAASAHAAFDRRAGEMLWCGGDPGWVTHTAYGLVAPLALGGAILLDEVPSAPTRCLSVLEDEPVAVWYTTPTVVRGLIGGGAAPARSFKPRALRLAACVGEPLSADAVEWGRTALGVAFRDTWWQTETGAVVLAHDPARPPLAGSMGRVLPGLRVELVRRDAQGGVTLLPPGPGTGELAVSTHCLPRWRSLGGERGAPLEEMEDWHLSGDMVRRDENGYFWFLGRDDEVILAGGRMIGPFEIEAVLMSHPAVAEVGVVGAPDTRSHEHPVAFVAVNPGFEAGGSLRRELMDYAYQHLGEGLSPQDIFFTQDLPRTTSGKIIRRALRIMAQSGVLTA